ncbi:hypothetical protein GCM10011507_09170 [Edaphobacter acidisoli]|uniref:Uncharacterized protein n=1 Tax=Edaphobacter acidisoli TaxID=2040573 RepID=A0A916RKJ2_9BACT|nr:hypothetical protein GCM10011507_09170 [Edaphobacter acidisoli]
MLLLTCLGELIGKIANRALSTQECEQKNAAGGEKRKKSKEGENMHEPAGVTYIGNCCIE